MKKVHKLLLCFGLLASMSACSSAETNENGEVVDSWISTKEPHKINGLEEGKTYTLHENYAPNGFVIATEVEFTVTKDKEIQPSCLWTWTRFLSHILPLQNSCSILLT